MKGVPPTTQYQQVKLGFLPSSPYSLGLWALTQVDVFFGLFAAAAFHLQLLALPVVVKSLI